MAPKTFPGSPGVGNYSVVEAMRALVVQTLEMVAFHYDGLAKFLFSCSHHTLSEATNHITELHIKPGLIN